MIVVKDGQVYQTPDVTEALNALKSKMTYADKLDQEAAEKYQKPIEIVGDLPEYGSISADAKVKMQSMLEDVNAKTVAAQFGSAAAGVASDAAAGVVNITERTVEGAANLAGKAAKAAVEGATGIPVEWMVIGGAALLVLILTR